VALGRVDVDGMLGELSVPQFLEWQLYSAVHPFGEERADLRAGIIASVIANANRGKRTQAYKPADFMPKFGRTPRKQTGEDIVALMKTAVRQTEGRRRG
jgi:hypothetical protein